MNRRKLGEDTIVLMVKCAAFISIVIIVFVFYFVFKQAWPVIKASGASLLTKGGFDKNIREAFARGPDEPRIVFGMLGLLWGTFASTVLALIAAAVLGIGTAVVIVEYTPPAVSSLLVTIVRLLASIPSIVFGLVGLMTIVPLIEKLFVTTAKQIAFLDFFQMTGKGLLASSIVLAFMIVPMVISLSIDALRGVPVHYKEAGFSFGMSRFRVVMKIILPSARSGVLASIVLAAGRGIGEAIAVSMVCGGVGVLPNLSMGFATMLAPVLTLSAAIVNKSEAMSVAEVESALFACGAILLVFGTLMSVGSRLIDRTIRKREGYDD